MYADGGGKVLAALNPILGGEHIARFFAGVMKKAQFDAMRAEFLMVNGQPGVLVFAGNDVQSVMTLALDENSKVARIFLVVNPEKLPGKDFSHSADGGAAE